MAYVEKNSLNEYIMIFFLSAFVFAVDLFFMISGYYMTFSYQRKIRKPVLLIIQLMLVKLVVYLITNISVGNPLSVKSMIASMIPANYFVIMYIVIFFISPYINIVLDSLSGKDYKIFIIIILSMFSVWSTGVNALNNLRGESFQGLDSVGNWGNQAGYTIVNFLVMYIIGASIRRFKIDKRIGIKIPFFGYIISAMITFLTILIETRMTKVLCSVATAYCNPFVVAEAFCIFVFFLNCNMGTIKAVNTLSKGVFTAFLIHFYFLNFIGIEKKVNKSAAMMILHIVGSSIVIFLMSVILYYLYDVITKPVFNLVFKKWDFTIVDIKKIGLD